LAVRTPEDVTVVPELKYGTPPELPVILVGEAPAPPPRTMALAVRVPEEVKVVAELK
jgi:hypothetical protein